MPQVTIFTRPYCPYCRDALKLLSDKGATVTEIDGFHNPDARQTMVERSGGRNTFPQIFVGDVHVGGCDDLKALETSGALDDLLAS
jgi:glutaredoxin 3